MLSDKTRSGRRSMLLLLLLLLWIRRRRVGRGHHRGRLVIAVDVEEAVVAAGVVAVAALRVDWAVAR